MIYKIIVSFLFLLLIACSEEIPVNNIQASNPDPISSEEQHTSETEYESDGYPKLASYDLDYLLLKNAPEVIDTHKEFLSHAWARANDCEYIKGQKSLTDNQLEIIAERVIQDAISEAYNYPNTFGEVISMKFWPNDYGEAKVGADVRIHHNYYGSRDTSSCNTTKYIPVRHNVYIKRLRNDLTVLLPGSIISKINKDTKNVAVKAIVKYRIEEADYRFKSSVKIIKHNAILEELALYEDNLDEPFKIFSEFELY